MDSMFHTQFFGRQRLATLGTAFMGQDMSDITGLTQGIEDLLKQLPPDLLGTYNARYRACADKISGGNIADTAIGGKCLYDLYQELKDVLKNGPPKAPVVVAPSTFPYLPVAVGVLGVGVLVYALAKLV